MNTSDLLLSLLKIGACVSFIYTILYLIRFLCIEQKQAKDYIVLAIFSIDLLIFSLGLCIFTGGIAVGKQLVNIIPIGCIIFGYPSLISGIVLQKRY